MLAVHGTVLTCTDAERGCRLQVRVPCPHGEGCACGHGLVPADGDATAPTPGA